MLFLGIALILLFFLLIALYSPIVLRVQLHREKERDQLDIHLRLLYGLYRIHYEVPFLDWQGNQVKWAEERDANTAPPKDDLKQVKISHWMQWLKEVKLELLLPLFYRKLCRILRHIRISQAAWHSQLGTGNAAHTATVSGLAWAAKSLFVQWLNVHLKAEEPLRYSITPCFHKRYFETRLHCILSLRLGYAIYTAIWVLRHVKRQSRKRRDGKAWHRNTPYKA